MSEKNTEAGAIAHHLTLNRLRTISQTNAKRIYCLTQKDINTIQTLSNKFGNQDAQGRVFSHQFPLLKRRLLRGQLDEEIVMNYALAKHGGTQQGIDLAIMQRNAARLQRASVIKCNVLERKARSAQVKTLIMLFTSFWLSETHTYTQLVAILIEYQDRGINQDWLHPSIHTIRQGIFMLPWTSYSEPMDRLIKYCRVTEFNMSEAEIRHDVSVIARKHMQYEDRIDCLHAMMIEVSMCMSAYVCV
jgi:hypothetical protein